MKPTEARKRYYKIFFLSMGLYLISTFAAASVLKKQDLPFPLEYALAIIPALFVWWLIWAQARFYKESDEYERSRQVTGMLYGVGAVLVLSTGWGFLEMLADAPKFPVFYIFPFFCMAYSFGRYRTKSLGETCS